jgi:hypothetical protein
MADAALAALRAATSECTATARRFNPEQSAEGLALADQLRAPFSRSTPTATAHLIVKPRAPLLPQLPSELIVDVLKHLDVRSLGRLARTCRQLYFRSSLPAAPHVSCGSGNPARAHEVGRWTPSSLPAGVSKWVSCLLQHEWRSALELRTVAANFALLACGAETRPGLLGLQASTSQTYFTAVAPTPVPSFGGADACAVLATSTAPSL